MTLSRNIKKFSHLFSVVCAPFFPVKTLFCCSYALGSLISVREARCKFCRESKKLLVSKVEDPIEIQFSAASTFTLQLTVTPSVLHSSAPMGLNDKYLYIEKDCVFLSTFCTSHRPDHLAKCFIQTTPPSPQ